MIYAILRVVLLDLYMTILILISIPFFIINKIDHRIKVKKKAFYKSFYVRANEKKIWINNFHNQTGNYPLGPLSFVNLPEFKGQVLQVGSGTGLFNKIILSKSGGQEVEMTDIDVNLKALKAGYAKGRIKKYVHCSITKTPFGNNSFDYIIFCNSIHHIHNLLPAFNECSRILKPNGKILILDSVSTNNKPDNQVQMINSSYDGIIWKFYQQDICRFFKAKLPASLNIKDIDYYKVKNILNYNFLYPHSQCLITIENITNYERKTN